MSYKSNIDHLTAHKKAFEELLRKQEEEKRNIIMEDDDMDCVTDILAAISNLLSKAADLSNQAASIINGETIEAACCCPYCSMGEVCYDEF